MTSDPSSSSDLLDWAVLVLPGAIWGARTLPFPFLLVGRAENYLHGRPDLDDTIRRLQAFDIAGADALYAPGLTPADDIRLVCGSVRKPVNGVMGLAAGSHTVAELAAMGVRRINVGSALSRVALAGVMTAAREMLDHGTFRFGETAVPYADANRLMAGRRRVWRTRSRPHTVEEIV
jgi:2-methylisocitrate lyase-like PEP mutase family enzyme